MYNRSERCYRLIYLTIIRSHTNQHTTTAVVTIWCITGADTTLLRIQDRNIEITILIASPAPVDMIKSLTIGTITDKLMTATGRRT